MNTLKTARFFRGISQARLARQADLDPVIISRIENDLLRDTPAVLRWKAKIAEILDTPVDALFPPETPKEKGQ